jgi:hypothetical protein
MSIIPTSRGNTQASDIAVEAVLPMTGNTAREDAQSTLALNDAEVAKLYEDRNAELSQGGLISFSGTQLTFTEVLTLEINSRVAGGSPVIIPLGVTFPNAFSGPFNVAVTGDMVYAVIDRIAGTAVITDNAATLPPINASNQEVFIIGKRNDAADGTKRFYFRDGTAIDAGQTIRLGAPSALSFQFFASSQINTTSTPITSSTFVTFNNSPSFTLIPSVTGKYKVYCPINAFVNGTGAAEAITRIINTSGGATLLYESQGYINGEASAGLPGNTSYSQSVYTLTIGITYVFDIQGKQVTGTGGIQTNGADAPFYMFAEFIGL